MARKRKVIQIVDDDPDLRIYLRRLLEGMGHEVHESEDIDSAVNTVYEIVPHLVLLDINLDEENGFNLIGHIRSFDENKRIKIIMISSSGSSKMIEFSKRFEVDGFLVKPIDNRTLDMTLKKIGPKLDFPETTAIDENYKHLIAKCIGQITKINEVSLVMRSKVNFSHKTKVSIDSEFLQRNNLGHAELIITKESQSVKAGIYDTTVQLIGLNEKNLQTIRKLKTKKA